MNIMRLPMGMPHWGLRSVAGLRGYWRLFRPLQRLVREEGIAGSACRPGAAGRLAGVDAQPLARAAVLGLRPRRGVELWVCRAANWGG